MIKETDAIVLAGGFGKRMGELTENKQKCLLEIEGKPILYHVIDQLVLALGSVDLKIGVAYLSDQVKEYVDRYAATYKGVLSVNYIPHAPGSESYGAYKTMKDQVKGPVVILPGDVIAKSEAYTNAMQLFQTSDCSLSMTFSPKLDEVDTHGVAKINNNEIITYEYPPPAQLDEDHLRDMNIYATDQEFFKLIEIYGVKGKPFSQGIARLIEEVSVFGNKYESEWIHVGYPSDLQKHF